MAERTTIRQRKHIASPSVICFFPPCVPWVRSAPPRWLAVNALAPWYGAAGLNIEVPVFNGFLYTARAREAQLRAQAAQQQLRNLQDNIARDVRTGWLNASTA